MSMHLAYPAALATAPDGTVTFATVPQDDPDEIRQSFLLLASLRPGLCAWDDELGIPDPLATTNPQDAADRIQAALSDQEPRHPIEVTVIDTDHGSRRVHLRLTPLAS